MSTMPAGSADAGQIDPDELKVQEETERKCTELLQKATKLMVELEEFRQFVATRKQAKLVEFRHFRGAVEAELKSLKKCSENPRSIKTAHTLRSANLHFFLSVWDTAKRSTGIIAMKKRFYWLPGEDALVNKPCGKQVGGSRDKRYSADVDIVAENGLQWVKVSTINAKRVLYDLARRGWAADSSDEDDLDWIDEDDEPDGLLKQAQGLRKAAQATRTQYQHPSIRFVLPRIKRGETKEVDHVLRKIEELGIVVQTADMLPIPLEFDSAILSEMVVNPFAGLSDPINVDCTMLLAFVSELSHRRIVENENWHIEAIRKQIEMEREDQLLKSHLWPACGARRLVCTVEAAQRMYEIVDLIGTHSEKKRARFLMERGEHLSQAQRIIGFQELSEYDVPKDWQLPIIAIEADIEDMKSRIPVDKDVVNLTMDSLLPINQSIFLYGWSEGLTTISSNGAVAKKIESTIEENRKQESDRGPQVWLCTTSRSLLAKEKERRGHS